jgi:hypothetical protein
MRRYVLGSTPVCGTDREDAEETTARGIASLYAELLDGLVADEPVDELPCLVTSTLMDTAERREAVAREVVSFGERCARSRSSP